MSAGTFVCHVRRADDIPRRSVVRAANEAAARAIALAGEPGSVSLRRDDTALVDVDVLIERRGLLVLAIDGAAP